MQTEIPFGTWLHKQRRALDLTRQALANQVGCAEITLRRIENGTLKPSKELAQILLEKLGIPIAEHEQWIQYARGLSDHPPETSQQPVPIQHSTNLPVALTTFIGRKNAQTEIASLIAKYRLVTLVGSGGVGKTRLALQVGHQLLADYPNGVWLVALEALADSRLVPQTIASVFHVRGSNDLPVIERLVDTLRKKTTLIILDNCEHVLDACAQLTDTLLKNCPNIKILATSREPLGITGEAIYRVPSLELPHVEQVLEKYREFESVRLFEERAQLAQTDFLLTLENVSFIVQICSRLDGIPLAIELAAAKVNMFSAKRIAEHLDESFNLLTGGSRTALPRQQTIRASINWSWDLLTESEQVFMRQLSIFAGSWTLESAQTVCDGDVLSLTQALGKKSLIAIKQEAGHETRYRFHEIIRQYAHEKLGEAGEEENIRSRHLKYFLQLSEQAEPALKRPEQEEWLLRLNDEHNNLRTALEWADRTDTEAGLYLSGRLQRFWESFDPREGLQWLTEFVQKPESKTFPIAKAKALLTQGWMLGWFEKYDLAGTAAKECLELYQTLNDQGGEIDALTLLANTTGKAPDKELLEQALSQAQLLMDIWRQARILSRMGWIDDVYQHRVAHWSQAITLFRKTGDLELLATYLGALGNSHLLNGDIESAQKNLDEAVQLMQRVKNKAGRRVFLTALGRLESIRGNFEIGRAFLEEGITNAEEFGNYGDYLWHRVHLGNLVLRQGKIIEAREIFDETVREYFNGRDEMGIALCLEGMAGLFISINKPEIAAQLIGWADATREKIRNSRPRMEQLDVDKMFSAIVAKIGSSAFEVAYDDGRKITMDEAVVLVLATKN